MASLMGRRSESNVLIESLRQSQGELERTVQEKLDRRKYDQEATKIIDEYQSLPDDFKHQVSWDAFLEIIKEGDPDKRGLIEYIERTRTELRRRNLCFLCKDSWKPNHKCKNKEDEVLIAEIKESEPLHDEDKVNNHETCIKELADLGKATAEISKAELCFYAVNEPGVLDFASPSFNEDLEDAPTLKNGLRVIDRFLEVDVANKLGSIEVDCLDEDMGNGEITKVEQVGAAVIFRSAPKEEHLHYSSDDSPEYEWEIPMTSEEQFVFSKIQDEKYADEDFKTAIHGKHNEFTCADPNHQLISSWDPGISSQKYGGEEAYDDLSFKHNAVPTTEPRTCKGIVIEVTKFKSHVLEDRSENLWCEANLYQRPNELYDWKNQLIVMRDKVVAVLTPFDNLHQEFGSLKFEDQSPHIGTDCSQGIADLTGVEGSFQQATLQVSTSNDEHLGWEVSMHETYEDITKDDEEYVNFMSINSSLLSMHKFDNHEEIDKSQVGDCDKELIHVGTHDSIEKNVIMWMDPRYTKRLSFQKRFDNSCFMKLLFGNTLNETSLRILSIETLRILNPKPAVHHSFVFNVHEYHMPRLLSWYTFINLQQLRGFSDLVQGVLYYSWINCGCSILLYTDLSNLVLKGTAGCKKLCALDCHPNSWRLSVDKGSANYGNHGNPEMVIDLILTFVKIIISYCISQEELGVSMIDGDHRSWSPGTVTRGERLIQNLFGEQIFRVDIIVRFPNIMEHIEDNSTSCLYHWGLSYITRTEGCSSYFSKEFSALVHWVRILTLVIDIGFIQRIAEISVWFLRTTAVGIDRRSWDCHLGVGGQMDEEFVSSFDNSDTLCSIRDMIHRLHGVLIFISSLSRVGMCFYAATLGISHIYRRPLSVEWIVDDIYATPLSLTPISHGMKTNYLLTGNFLFTDSSWFSDCPSWIHVAFSDFSCSTPAIQFLGSVWRHVFLTGIEYLTDFLSMYGYVATYDFILVADMTYNSGIWWPSELVHVHMGDLCTRLHFGTLRIDTGQFYQKKAGFPRTCTLNFGFDLASSQEVVDIHDDTLLNPEEPVLLVVSCEPSFDDDNTRWDTHDYSGIPWAQAGEFHFGRIMRCAHQFSFSPPVQYLMMTWMTQRDGLNKGRADSLGYGILQILVDESKFDRILTYFSPVECFQQQEFEIRVDWTLGVIRVVQRKSVGVEINGLPVCLWIVCLREVHHRSSGMAEFTVQQMVEILVHNLYKGEFQIWDLGVYLLGSWLHRMAGLDHVKSYNYLQGLLVRILSGIIWDPGGWWTGTYGLSFRYQRLWQWGWFVVADCLRTSNVREGRTVMSPRFQRSDLII